MPAIVEAWYGGQAAGSAIAEVLFGDVSPAGRLPVTVYRSVDQLPPFSDYDMAGRTYRYFRGDPLFPFGHGLSYTTFRYRNLGSPSGCTPARPVRVSVEVENTGAMAADEVVQAYLTDTDASVPVPVRSLVGFAADLPGPGGAPPGLLRDRPDGVLRHRPPPAAGWWSRQPSSCRWEASSRANTAWGTRPPRR